MSNTRRPKHEFRNPRFDSPFKPYAYLESDPYVLLAITKEDLKDSVRLEKIHAELLAKYNNPENQQQKPNPFISHKQAYEFLVGSLEKKPMELSNEEITRAASNREKWQSWNEKYMAWLKIEDEINTWDRAVKTEIKNKQNSQADEIAGVKKTQKDSMLDSLYKLEMKKSKAETEVLKELKKNNRQKPKHEYRNPRTESPFKPYDFLESNPYQLLGIGKDDLGNKDSIEKIRAELLKKINLPENKQIKPNPFISQKQAYEFLVGSLEKKPSELNSEEVSRAVSNREKWQKWDEKYVQWIKKENEINAWDKDFKIAVVAKMKELDNHEVVAKKSDDIKPKLVEEFKRTR